MIKFVYYGGKAYPFFQTEGNAARFAIPFATQVCHGIGYDIGCNKEEWSLPGSNMIDPVIDSRWHAMNLPVDQFGAVNYIFSSHCLEHVDTPWYTVLQYWKSNLKPGGVLFLYLPDYSQEYWRPWNNNKHKHVFTPDLIRDAFNALNLQNVFVSGVDLNNSFMAMGNL